MDIENILIQWEDSFLRENIGFTVHKLLKRSRLALGPTLDLKVKCSSSFVVIFVLQNYSIRNQSHLSNLTYILRSISTKTAHHRHNCKYHPKGIFQIL
jgi:hypothetical protein